MSTKRLWAIVGGAAALVAIVVILVVTLGPRASQTEPTAPPTSTPSSEPSATISSTAVPSAAPTPESSAPAATTATCENTSSDAFRAAMASKGWVSWETQDQQVGARPFDAFPNGTPDGAIVCRWGEGPDIPTDNIVDLAWTPIDPENAVAAMATLEDAGFTRLDEPEGIYLAMKGPEGYTDDEGWGQTYLFGFEDVRWAATKADVSNNVKAPDEAG